MNEKFEYQGYWWLPSADEEKVPGILKFDPEDGASLDLLGSLKGLKGVIDPLEPELCRYRFRIPSCLRFSRNLAR